MLTIRQAQINTMAQGSPGVRMSVPCPGDATWIEVQLVDADQLPVAGQKYLIKLPDGAVMPGKLDNEGKVRFESITPGTAEISFPEIDAREWKEAPPKA
jgi:hypothetical protein